MTESDTTIGSTDWISYDYNKMSVKIKVFDSRDIVVMNYV